MTLLELCEPLLLYVCRLNRSGRKGGHFDAVQAQLAIKSLLAQMKSRAAALPATTDALAKMERPLVYFVDSMILSSKLDLATAWEPLQVEFWTERAGDQKFFDELEETMQDRSDAANERLAVFYTCIGLGFTGVWAGQPEHLRRLNAQIAARIRGQMETEDTALICPDAYEHLHPPVILEPLSRSLTKIVIALCAFIIAMFVGNLLLYQQHAGTLTSVLDNIRTYSPPGPPSTP